jgi:transcriptional regulator of nitric oxide reductase
MVNQAHVDHGTVLRPDQAAFVVNADGSYSLLLPDLAEGEAYSAAQMLVVAFAARLEDEDFRQDMFDFLGNLHAEGRRH